MPELPSIPDGPVTDLFDKLAGWFWNAIVGPFFNLILGLWNGVMAHFAMIFLMIVLLIIFYPAIASNYHNTGREL